MNIIEKLSPNFDGRGDRQPYILLMHYTGMKTGEEALSRLTDVDAKVSAHYTVDEDGSVYAHVEENKRAWHAGVSYWQGEKDINAVSIGVEIVNRGHEFGYRNFSDGQLESVKKLCLSVKRRHNIEYVLGHSDVAPNRKQDPGELFPWKDFAKSGVGVWPADLHENVSEVQEFDVVQALKGLGYGDFSDQELIVAFQRHYVPEVFLNNAQGQVCGLTRARLYALHANHLISAE